MKFLKEIFKRVKLKTIILLILLLMFNTVAWFVYSTKASTKLKAYIESWNVSFQAGENDLITNIEFDVEKIYPGMEDFVKEVTARNYGDKVAELSYLIKEVVILGQVYSCEDGVTTPEDLAELLESEDYPFRIIISIENDGELEPLTGICNCTISLVWPFEQGNDMLDTYWGELAYEYYSQNPDAPSISLKIELKATQLQD